LSYKFDLHDQRQVDPRHRLPEFIGSDVRPGVARPAVKVVGRGIGGGAAVDRRAVGPQVSVKVRQRLVDQPRGRQMSWPPTGQGFSLTLWMMA
jgi:hypothetical protein